MQGADASGAPASGETGDIERIRDILFGANIQDYAHRFTRLEAQLQQAEADLREELKQRCDRLERTIQTELKAIQARLTTEQNTRSESVQSLVQDVTALGVTLEAKAAQLEQQTTTSHRELQQSLLQEATRLADEIQQNYTDMSARVDQQLEAIRHDKTDRVALADLLDDLSLRLKNGQPPATSAPESSA